MYNNHATGHSTIKLPFELALAFALEGRDAGVPHFLLLFSLKGLRAMDVSPSERTSQNTSYAFVGR